MRQSWILHCSLVFLSFGESINGNNDWDVLLFTQNWPPSACQEFKDHGENHACTKLKSPDSWTVHGVWPTKIGTLGPGFCDPNNKFDPSQIVSMVDELNDAWPSIDAERGSTPFWGHEWEKHGTCAMQLPALADEAKYFRKGLDWISQYNMTNILSMNGLVPSDEPQHPVMAFQQAVLSSLGVNPRLECVFHKHMPYLLEIRICFNKTLELVDCDGTMQGDKPLVTNCPLVGNIHYGLRMPPDQPEDVPPTRPASNPERVKFVRMLRTVIDVLAFLDWVI